MSDIVAFVPMRALDANGVPVPGALAYFYQSGTSTPVTVYSDVAETVPHTTPVVADGSGVFPPVYRSGVALKCDVTDPDDVPLPGYPIDPLIAVGAASSAASAISFNATGDIPETNVQAAIERVQANIIDPLTDFGLGITGDAPDIANLDLTTHATGFYRFTATTTGTRPSGWAGSDTGVVEIIRYNANNAWMIAKRTSDNVVAQRRLQTGVWQTWQVGFNTIEGAALSGTTTATGPVRVADGTSGAPAVSFTSETTLGLYRPFAGMVGVSGVLGSFVSTKKVQVDANGPGLLIGSGANEVTITGDWTSGAALQFDGAGRFLEVGDSIFEYNGDPVVATGTNANGRWVQFYDGTMICTHTVSFANISTAVGGVFASPVVAWSFPVPFASGVILGSPAVNNTDAWGNAYNPTVSGCDVRAFAAASKGFAINGFLTATGRWK